MIVISLTSIFQRQDILARILIALSKQTIFTQDEEVVIELNISEEQYLLDKGFENQSITYGILYEILQKFTNININWVKNTGPYRKLLPTLEKYWDYPKEADIKIITIDDDLLMLSRNYLENLINAFISANKNLLSTDKPISVAYRGYTMNWDEQPLKYYLPSKSPISRQEQSLYNFSTNGCGTVWTPEMFKQTTNSREILFNYEKIISIAKTADDIWFNFNRIYNDIQLKFVELKPKSFRLLTDKSTALYYNYNGMNIIEPGKCMNSEIMNFVYDYLFNNDN